MEALTAMGFPEHMCAKAMRMTGGDVEAAANYIMGNLDQPEQWWFGSPGEPDALAQRLVAEARLDSDEGEEAPADTMEALLDGLEPERREAFAEAAVSALRALKAASAEQVAALGIDESHARLLREPLPPGRPVSPPHAANSPPPDAPPPDAPPPDASRPDVAASSPRESPFLAAAVSASASSAIEQVQRLEEALGRARGPPRTSSRVVAARDPAPAVPNPALKELEQDGSDPPVYLLCGQGLEILDDGLQVRRAAAATSQHCWAATTSGRKYVEVVVESISSSLPSSSDADTDRRDPFGGGPADIMLSMLRGDGDGDPFGSPFGGPFGFGERPLRTRGLTRFGVRTDLEDLDVDGQLHEREGSRPGRATWMLHQKKIVKNGRGVASYSAIMDNLRAGDRVGALVHNRTLTFYLNGKSQGVATSGLPSDARTLHFVVDMQGTVDSFRLLPEHTTPKTQEELEMGTIAGLIKSASLTADLLAEKIKADADGREARAVDQDGRTALHFLCRDHPGASAEMLSMLAQAYPDATSLADQSGKTPLLYLLGGDDTGAPKTVLDFATEAEYAQYLLPLCSAGAKLQAAKDLNHQVRLGTVGEYVDSDAEKGVQVNWSIPADRRPGAGRRSSRETREAGALVFGADDNGDRKQKRWQSWSSVVLAHDDHEQQQAAAAKEKPEVNVEMIDALINANGKCVTEADSDGLLPVQVAERTGVAAPVLDRLVQLSLAAGLVWCGGRTPTSMDAAAAAADQYGIHVLLTSVSGTAVNASSSTLAKMAENAAHRSATRLHGLPFGVDEVKMSVCGPTHFVFLLKTGAVWRLPFKPLAGAAGNDPSGLNPQVSTAEQRIEAVRSQLSARRMRVKHIEAQINAAEAKVFPVPAPELQSLCDVTRKPREECEAVLRRLRPRSSRLELAMHMLMGEQPEHNGQPAEFWEGDEVGRLQYELRKETKSIEKDTKQIKEIQDSIDAVSASSSATSATQTVVNPPVSVGAPEEWQLEIQHGSRTVAFTHLAVSLSTLLLLGENGILYCWDWRPTDDRNSDGDEGMRNDTPAPYRGEHLRARELLQPLPRCSAQVQESEGGTVPEPEAELELEPEPEVEVEDKIVQVSSSSWRTSVLTASGRVASWIDSQCHDAAKRKPPEAPAAVHNGVSCDKSGMSPIIGLRYKLKGKNYDVCEAEFAKLDDEEKLLYVRIAQPHGSEEEITPEDIEMANMAASASATGLDWAVGVSSPLSILECLEHRLCLPGLPPAASAVAASPADDVDGSQAEGNDATQRLQEEEKVEKVVDIAVSNWGTIARSSKNNVYWWGRRPYNPSSAAAAAVPHSRTKGQSNIAKDFKAALSKYRAVTASESDDSGTSGRGPSTSLSSLQKIKSEIFELAGDSDAYSARLMQLGVGTAGADALRSAVELYQSAASALSKGDRVVLCSSLDHPLYEVNTPVMVLQNDNDTCAGAVAQTYFLQNPISRSRLQRERRVKVVDSSGSTTTVNIRDVFFLVAEYQPVEATVLKVDAQRGVVVLLPSQAESHQTDDRCSRGGNAPTPMIYDITDVTPVVAETAAMVNQSRSIVRVSEPCAIFTKQLLGSDLDGRLGSAIVARSAESSITDSSREEHDLLSEFTIDSMTVSGWHATIMLNKDCRELWKFVADVSRACWTCAPSRLKLTAVSNEGQSQGCSDADTATPAVHILGVKQEVVGLSTTTPVWVDDGGFVHSSSSTSAGQTKSDDSAAASRLPRVRFLSTCIASGEAGSSDRSLGRWEFEEAPGSWRPYSAGDCQRLDEAERKSQSTCELTFPYVAELRAKRQINRSTGRDRRIRRRPSASGRRSDVTDSGDPLVMLLGFEPTSGTEGDDGSGGNLQFAGRTDLHDAVLEGFEAVQKLLNRNGGGATEGDDSTATRKMLLQRDIMGANAFHFAMQHGLVAEASAICATAVDACSGTDLLNEMICQPNLVGTPPLHALLGLELDQMLLQPQRPKVEMKPVEDDGGVPSSGEVAQQLKALLLGPGGETLMTATNSAGHTPLQAYICQPPHGPYRANVNKAGKEELVQALVKLLSTSTVAVKSCLLPLLSVGSADDDELDLFVFQLVNRGSLGGSGDSTDADTDLPANFARAVAKSELRCIGQIFMQSCVRVYSALYAGKAQASQSTAPRASSTGSSRQSRQQHDAAQGQRPPSFRGRPSSLGQSGSVPGGTSTTKLERKGGTSNQSMLSKQREQAFWSVFTAAPALAIEALACTADKATHLLRLGLPVDAVPEIAAAGQGQILIRASMNDSGPIPSVFDDETVQPPLSPLSAARTKSRQPFADFTHGDSVKLKSSTPLARMQGVPSGARGVIQALHPNKEVTVRFSMRPVEEASDTAVSVATARTSSSDGNRVGRGRSRGSQRERRSESASADVAEVESRLWGRGLASRGPDAGAIVQDQEQELRLSHLEDEHLVIVDRPPDDGDLRSLPPQDDDGPGFWMPRPGASSFGDAGGSGAGHAGLFGTPFGRPPSGGPVPTRREHSSPFARYSAASTSAERAVLAAARPSGFGAPPGGARERERQRDQPVPGGFGARVRAIGGPPGLSAPGLGGGPSPFGAPIAVSDIAGATLGSVFGGGFEGVLRDGEDDPASERESEVLSQLLRDTAADELGFAPPSLIDDSRGRARGSTSRAGSSREGSQRASSNGFGFGAGGVDRSPPQRQTGASLSTRHRDDEQQPIAPSYTWRGPVEYLEKATDEMANPDVSATSAGICSKVQRARIFHLCVNTIAELAELWRSSQYMRQQQSVDGSETAQPAAKDHLLAQWTDDAALRSTAKLALTDAARTLQPAWEHVFDCCEVAEEGLTRAAHHAAHDVESKQHHSSSLAPGQRLPFTAFMQAACATNPESSTPDPLQYRYIAYMLDALVRFKQSLPAPWESEAAIGCNDDEVGAMTAATAGWSAPAEAVALGAVANGVAPLVRSVSMIQPLNEGQCDAISAGTRRKILRSTFNIDPDPGPQSSGSATKSSSSSSAGAVTGRSQLHDDDDLQARALNSSGRESVANGNGSRELLEQTPLVATLLSWPMTLAMLSKHYLYSISDESDSNPLDGMAAAVAGGGAAGSHSGYRSGPGSFFQLLEPFHAKESKFRRCMHELTSGEIQSQKLLLKVHRGDEALRADVCSQLAELRSKCVDGEHGGSGGSKVSTRGRPWLCRQLEGTKPWFVDGMGEGKGVVRSLVAEFVAAVTASAPAQSEAETAGDPDEGTQAGARPLLVPCPADSAADSGATWRRMVPAPASPAAEQTASPDKDMLASADSGATAEEGEPGSTASDAEAVERDEVRAATVARELRLEEYRSLGNIAGLCLLHGGEEFGLRLPCYLSRHVYKYLLGREVSFVDYAYYDPTEYETLTNLLAQTNTILSAAESQGGANSSASGSNSHGQAAAPTATSEQDPDAPLSEDGLLEWDESVGVFVPPGAERCPRPVTARNATAWCFAKARWEMVGKVEDELRAMRLGVHDVIPSSVLAALALTADDLQMLLTGTGSTLSMDDWRSAVRFEDLRSAGARAADSMDSEARLAAFSTLFWQALEGMTARQRIDLAFFSTASMTVLDTLTVNLRDLETTALGGELDTITARTCTAELNIPDYRDIGYQTTTASAAGAHESADDHSESHGQVVPVGGGGAEVLRARLLRAAEMAEVLGFTSV